MKERIKHIIESNLLEDYIFGLTNESDSQEIEDLLSSSTELQQAYDELQDGVEAMAKKTAITPPADLKAKVVKAIPEDAKSPAAESKSTSSWLNKSNLFILLTGISALYFYLRFQNSQRDLDTMQETILAMENDSKVAEDQYIAQLNLLTNPNIQKHSLKGNELAPDFSSEAFWNEKDGLAYMYINHLPPLPNKKCYQLWADVDGVMLSVVVLPSSIGGLIPLRYYANAESLNITIEEEGGSDHPNVGQLVASVGI